MTLGQKIRKARLDRLYTQEHLAYLVGISRVQLIKYERDESDPRFLHICCIAKALGLSLDYLAWGESR